MLLEKETIYDNYFVVAKQKILKTQLDEFLVKTSKSINKFLG